MNQRIEMEYTAEDIELALTYAQNAEFEAYLNPQDQGQVLFKRTPYPEGLSEKMIE